MSATLSRQGLRLDTKAPAALSGDRAARTLTAPAATEPPDAEAATTTAELRRVFDAPRGRRFARPGARTAARPAAQPDRTGTRPAASRLASRPASQPCYRPSGRPTTRTATVPGARPKTARDPLPPLASLGRTPRERALLAQMPDDPRVCRRLTQGELPAWMDNVIPKAEPPEPPEPSEPRPCKTPVPEPGDGPRPEPARIPRPRREYRPPLPLPRRSGRRRSTWPPRPASHRKPCKRRAGPLLVGYALTTTLGALGHHLYGLLL
ncbi:hypothetical protein ACOALZ_00670 [Nocardiopsis algeriensis]|uniref:hypothetical protein n=1 Tax=Nocardiopsis algeriensis TaxID=1478215 RepID=UPI003B4388EA